MRVAADLAYDAWKKTSRIYEMLEQYNQVSTNSFSQYPYFNADTNNYEKERLIEDLTLSNSSAPVILVMELAQDLAADSPLWVNVLHHSLKMSIRNTYNEEPYLGFVYNGNRTAAASFDINKVVLLKENSK